MDHFDNPPLTSESTATSNADPKPRTYSINLGECLLEAREANGLSVQDVASDLHINKNLVTALEENKFETISSPVFVKGYLRNYARLVGLDPEPLIQSFMDATEVQSPSLEPLKYVETGNVIDQYLPSKKVVTGVSYGIGFLLFLWAGQGVYQFVKELRKNESVEFSQLAPIDEHNQTNFKARSLRLEPFGDSLSQTRGDDLTDITQESTALSLSSKTKSTNELPQPKTSGTDDQKMSLANSEITIAEGNKKTPQPATLQVLLTADSWVEVYDAADRSLLTWLGKAGSTKIVSGKPPFRVVLGKPSGVQLEFNGEPYTITPPRRGTVARFTVGH